MRDDLGSLLTAIIKNAIADQPQPPLQSTASIEAFLIESRDLLRNRVAAPLPAQDKSPYLNSDEAIEYLRLKGGRSGLYFLMREHALPFLRLGGRLRFDRRELDAWMHDNSATIELRTRKNQSPPPESESGLLLQWRTLLRQRR
jgi:excisionase family DNA binding protein